MFNKELFLSLCEKYNVELSDTAIEPMLRVGDEVRPITSEDINRILVPEQVCFDYSNDIRTGIKQEVEFDFWDDLAIAC